MSLNAAVLGQAVTRASDGVRNIDLRVATATTAGLALTAGAVATGVIAVSTRDYGEWAPLWIAPALFLLTLPALRRQAEREGGDPRVLWLLVAALAVKFLGAALRYYAAFEVYGGHADAKVYHHYGADIAQQLRAGNLAIDVDGAEGTATIRWLTGIVYALTGTSQPGGFVVFAWLAFLGQFGFYRAFRTALPDGRRWVYAAGIFFLPTLVFWPSSTGKDAWMVFALGLATVGAMHLSRAHAVQGIAVAATGLWLAALVRPHVAGILALALAAGALLRRPGEHLGALAPVAKGAAVVIVVAATGLFVARGSEFVTSTLGTGGDGGPDEVLTATAERTRKGGSEFDPVVVRSPIDLPPAAVTVLFRPHLLEVSSPRAALMALESTVLLTVALVGSRHLIRALRDLRRVPYVAVAIVFTLLFIVAFSSIANFGILVRQRAQVLPFLLVLLALPPRGLRAAPITMGSR